MHQNRCTWAYPKIGYFSWNLLLPSFLNATYINFERTTGLLPCTRDSQQDFILFYLSRARFSKGASFPRLFVVGQDR